MVCDSNSMKVSRVDVNPPGRGGVMLTDMWVLYNFIHRCFEIIPMRKSHRCDNEVRDFAQTFVVFYSLK